jgi:hypothetical protein
LCWVKSLTVWPWYKQTHRRKESNRTILGSCLQRAMDCCSVLWLNHGLGLPLLPPLRVWGPWEEMRCWVRVHPSIWWMAGVSQPIRGHLVTWRSYLSQWIVQLIFWPVFGSNTGCQIYRGLELGNGSRQFMVRSAPLERVINGFMNNTRLWFWKLLSTKIFLTL